MAPARAAGRPHRRGLAARLVRAGAVAAAGTGASPGAWVCRGAAPPRRGLRALPTRASAVDPAAAARLEAAQEQVRVARLNLQQLQAQLVGRNWFSEPLERGYIAQVMGLFAPESSRAMRPLLDAALGEVLPEARDMEVLAALLCGMTIARLPHEPAWRAVGDAVIERCGGASPEQLVEAAWAFAVAGERQPGLFAALKGAMAPHVGGHLAEDHRRVFAWACAEVGEHPVELFGHPDTRAPEASSRAVLGSLAAVAAGEASRQGAAGAEVLCADPVPIVLVPGVLSPSDGRALVALADDLGLWRPSSRRGARDMNGVDAVRTSTSAVLSSPRCMQHPATLAVRRWAAAFLGVPLDHVEALQLVRYHQGQQYGPHVDWGTEQDASMWLAGQRTATALIYIDSLPEGCGGETHFTQLGVKVAPRAGAALVWANVDASGSPLEVVEHQARPVLCAATKHAVNVWVRGRPLPRQGGQAW